MNRWSPIVVALLLSLCLVACEKASERGEAIASEDVCDPSVELERCDENGRLQCDTVAGVWIFIGACEPLTYCIETEVEDEGPARITQCVVEKDPQDLEDP